MERVWLLVWEAMVLVIQRGINFQDWLWASACDEFSDINIKNVSLLSLIGVHKSCGYIVSWNLDCTYSLEGHWSLAEGQCLSVEYSSSRWPWIWILYRVLVGQAIFNLRRRSRKQLQKILRFLHTADYGGSWHRKAGSAGNIRAWCLARPAWWPCGMEMSRHSSSKPRCRCSMSGVEIHTQSAETSSSRERIKFLALFINAKGRLSEATIQPTWCLCFSLSTEQYAGVPVHVNYELPIASKEAHIMAQHSRVDLSNQQAKSFLYKHWVLFQCCLWLAS